MVFSANWRISSRRHRQSDVAAIRVPSSLVKGSGSLALAAKEPGSDTGQLAPSSSTGAVSARPPAARAGTGLTVEIVVTPAPTRAAMVATRIALRLTVKDMEGSFRNFRKQF